MSTTTLPGTGRIVVGVDGSDGGTDALRWAARMASALDRSLLVATSWAYPAAYGFGGVAGIWRPDEDAAAMLAGTLKSVFDDAVPPSLTTTVDEGHPAQLLTALGEGAEMLVVGSRGHGGFAGLLLGSVSTYCAEHAPCPVVVVHAAA